MPRVWWGRGAVVRRRAWPGCTSWFSLVVFAGLGTLAVWPSDVDGARPDLVIAFSAPEILSSLLGRPQPPVDQAGLAVPVANAAPGLALFPFPVVASAHDAR